MLNYSVAELRLTSFMKRKVKLPGTVMPMPGKKERLTGIRWKQPFIWHPNIKAKE